MVNEKTLKRHRKTNTSLVLSLALVLLTVGAALADAPTQGSITVAQNNNGQTYTLYKLFDAEITFTGNETDGYTQSAITYKLPTGKTLDTTGAQWFEVNTNGFVEATTALTESVMKSRAFIDWAKGFGTQVGSALTAASDNDANIKWEDLSFGYYLVDSTLGAFVSIDSVNPNMSVNDKNNPPKIDKKIKSVKDSSNADSGSIFNATAADEIQWEGDGSNEHAIAQIGDTITYTIDVTVKPGAEAYVVTDTLDAGLTAPAAADVSVSIDNTNYTVAVSGQVITVTFTDAYLNSITEDTIVTIEYSAVLNASAVIADVNNNKARLEWGHKTTKDYTEDESKVWTAKIGVNKKINSADGSPLAGAGFVLKNSANKYYKKDAATDVVTWVDDIEQATLRTTDEDGTIDPFTGLDNGVYTLVEKVVPAGYNKTADTEITIAGSNVTEENLVQTATVINNAGTELPSTGGIGTTLFYLIGGLLVVGAAVVLVARRKAE